VEQVRVVDSGPGCRVDDGERSVRARRLRAAGVEWRPRVRATKRVGIAVNSCVSAGARDDGRPEGRGRQCAAVEGASLALPPMPVTGS
jgi:hypothetical protein